MWNSHRIPTHSTGFHTVPLLLKPEEKRDRERENVYVCGICMHACTHTHTYIYFLSLFQTGLVFAILYCSKQVCCIYTVIWIRGYIQLSASHLMYINKNAINTTELVGKELHFGFNNISRLCHNWCQQSSNKATWETYRCSKAWVKPFWKKGMQGIELCFLKVSGKLTQKKLTNFSTLPCTGKPIYLETKLAVLACYQVPANCPSNKTWGPSHFMTVKYNATWCLPMTPMLGRHFLKKCNRKFWRHYQLTTTW
jgi:hypothetical protein